MLLRWNVQRGVAVIPQPQASCLLSCDCHFTFYCCLQVLLKWNVQRGEAVFPELPSAFQMVLSTRSSTQVLLKWNVQRGVAVIPKAGSEPHLAENIEGLFSWRLTWDQKVCICSLGCRSVLLRFAYAGAAWGAPDRQHLWHVQLGPAGGLL